jgi:hypothetical protein
MRTVSGALNVEKFPILHRDVLLNQMTVYGVHRCTRLPKRVGVACAL